ncbi:cytochrome P450 [Hygrophoropsis aurantiaca]|uniref:Cytochrome P450 n=1 Tax=Hygrophoropsis aurantiaca TaxID=72124 RepID=A0ACB8A3X4_9AGAM|nr:cytochrome P450 [Hygrophoropsis aurantiaca]
MGGTVADLIRHIPLSLVAGVLFVILALRFSTSKAATGGLPYPPGPPRLPFLGNLFLVKFNNTRPWLTYTEWGKKYGGIVYSRILGQDYIIINSAEVAKALLAQRYWIYSERPGPASYKLFGLDRVTVSLGHTDEWRLHRKLFHQTLRQEAMSNYHDLQLQKAREMIMTILAEQDPLAGPGKHFDTYSASLILSIVYGYETAKRDDPVVKLVWQLLTTFSDELYPERAAVLSAFPALANLPAWVPGMGFKRRAHHCQHLMEEVAGIPFRHTKEQVALGIAPPSMVADFLHEQTKEIVGTTQWQALEDTMKMTAASVTLGGAETVSSSLLSLVMAMFLYPGIQEKAWAEIDAVVGPDRLPTFEDRPSLPYIEAIVREILRWNPVGPLGVPHATNTNDIYKGYFIPKDAIVIYNAWAMSRVVSDPSDPSHFNPDRHFLPNGELSSEHVYTSNPGFGFGRRACPGRYFAENSTWAGIVTMLATLRFEKAKDAHGKDIEVRHEFSTGMAIHPMPFQCVVTVRSAERENEIRSLSGPTFL